MGMKISPLCVTLWIENPIRTFTKELTVTYGRQVNRAQGGLRSRRWRGRLLLRGESSLMTKMTV
jgi:hypothetical protein